MNNRDFDVLALVAVNALKKCGQAPEPIRTPDEVVERVLTSIEQWASLMRRGQFTQVRSVGNSIGRDCRDLRAAIAACEATLRAEERERCANIAHGFTGGQPDMGTTVAKLIEAAIRQQEVKTQPNPDVAKNL